MKSIELFAGAGGLAIGTANAGFHHVATLEWNRNACDTLRRNKADGLPALNNCEIVECDVSQYAFQQHRGDVNFVFGGPPCQPFSLGGKHRGQDDARNMFPQAVRAVREIRPQAFLFENVKGLLRGGFNDYYNYILRQLEFPTLQHKDDEPWRAHWARLEELRTSDKFRGVQYNVSYQILNAADWGVPQTRERVFVVGIRSDVQAEFSFPTRPTHTADALLHAKWISGEYWERHRVPKRLREPKPTRQSRRIERLRDASPARLGLPWRTVRDALSDLPKITTGQTSSRVANHYLNPGAKSYPGHTGSPWDQPAKTLKAGDHGVPGGENMLRMFDGTVRYFSVRECARLQTFPDAWTLEGAWSESMRQLGNAVPVKLAEIVAQQLSKVMSVSSHQRVEAVASNAC